MKSLEELLAPVSDDTPGGEDLDESIEFDRLRGAFDQNFPIDARVQELEEGEPEPVPVDWGELLGLIEELGEKTKNVYLSVSYARCGFTLRDPDVLDRGLQYTAGLLEEFAETVHPMLDGDYGEEGRALICEDLAARGAFALPFLELPVIVEERFSITADQLRMAEELGASSDAYPDVMRGLEQLEDERKNEIAAQMASFQASIDRIETALKGMGKGVSPDFSTTREFIAVVQTAFGKLAGLGGGDDENADGDALEDGVAFDGESGASFGGAVKSRDDVIRALTAIEQYYARAEPSNPVKFACGRLRSWVTMDFLEILEDIVPNSVDDAKSVLLDRRDME